MTLYRSKAYSTVDIGMLKLRGTKPLIEEALKVGPRALLVYVWLWDSAEKHHESDTGGTTTWSHKALADKLRMSNTTVIASINGLLDAGLIQREGLVPPQGGKGSWKNRYRVTHPQMLEAQRQAISVMGPPSERPKPPKKEKPNDDNEFYEFLESQSPAISAATWESTDVDWSSGPTDEPNRELSGLSESELERLRRGQEDVCPAEGSGAEAQGTRRQIRTRSVPRCEPFGWNKSIPKEVRARLKRQNAERVARYQGGLDA